MKMPKPYTGDKPYLFVSYSHKDRDEVVSVIAHLQQLGYHVWFDDGIDPGTEYAKVIANRLKGASIFVGFLSDHFYQSRYCKGEINYAHSHDKQILTVYLRNEPMPEEFSLWYNIYQSIHKYKYQDETEFYQKFAETEGIKCCMQQADETLSLTHAAAHGDAKSQFLLGVQYGNKGMHDTALAFYKMAAANDYAPAIHNIALSAANGWGMPKNHKTAVKYYTLAAKQNYAPSLHCLGLCHAHSDWGTELDHTKSVYYYRRAIEVNNYPASLWCLGLCYAHDGWGTEGKDMKKAADLYRQAAEQNYSEAQYTLGLCYLHSDWGTEYDPEQARYWLHAAADLGHEKAQQVLQELANQEKS